MGRPYLSDRLATIEANLRDLVRALDQPEQVRARQGLRFNIELLGQVRAALAAREHREPEPRINMATARFTRAGVIGAVVA